MSNQRYFDFVNHKPKQPLTQAASNKQPVPLVTPSQTLEGVHRLPLAQPNKIDEQLTQSSLDVIQEAEQPITTTPVSQFVEDIVALPVEKERVLLTFSKLQLGFLLLGIIVLSAGITATFLGFKQNSIIEAQTTKLQTVANEDAGDIPSEVPVTQERVKMYAVASDMPRLISIPKIGVEARIKPLGVKSNNELKAPDNVYDTGWYEGSAKPGQGGAALIDGHVHGLTKPGVFYDLKKLVPGDTIVIERGDNKKLTYAVVKSQTYDQKNVDMAAALTPIVAGKEGLNLITCSGKVDKATNRYSERLVVFAVLTE